MTLSLEREASLERSRVQLEIDWQRRCEEAERTGYDKQEELVTNLTQGKEEVDICCNVILETFPQVDKKTKIMLNLGSKPRTEFEPTVNANFILYILASGVITSQATET